MTTHLKLAVSCQWFHNGDFPNESPEVEGTVVRYFRHPYFDGSAKCPHCNDKYHNHGFVDRKGSMVVCPGDVLFSFEKPDSSNFINSIGKMSANTFRTIFGTNALYRAQMNCGSFNRGDTSADMLGFQIRNAFIPHLLTKLNNRLRLCGIPEYQFSPMPKPANGAECLPHYVECVNTYVREFWNIVGDNKYKGQTDGTPNVVVKVWSLTEYAQINMALEAHGQKLLTRSDYINEYQS